MIDATIIKDAELLEKAKEVKRQKSRDYNRKWRRDFKEKHGVDYETFVIMRKLSKGE